MCVYRYVCRGEEGEREGTRVSNIQCIMYMYVHVHGSVDRASA